MRSRGFMIIVQWCRRRKKYVLILSSMCALIIYLCEIQFSFLQEYFTDRQMLQHRLIQNDTAVSDFEENILSNTLKQTNANEKTENQTYYTTTAMTTTTITQQIVYSQHENEKTSFKVSTGNPTRSFEMEPTPGERHTIFLETRCVLSDSENNYTGLLLGERQACVVESAAKMDPDYKVYLLYSCPIVGSLESSSDYVKAVLSYPNVWLWKLNMSVYLTQTPLENWNFPSMMMSSKWPKEHTSDVLRFITLWKYGGTYMDLDVIAIKSLKDLASNYAGAQSSVYVASGVMNFDSDGIGHELASICVEELRRNFRGDIWIHNGPGLITRVLLKFCKSSSVRELIETLEKCKGFKVLKENFFYPISYPKWRLFFNVERSNETMEIIKDSYGVHFWNKMSKETPIKVGSRQPFCLLMEKACPKTYSVSGDIM